MLKLGSNVIVKHPHSGTMSGKGVITGVEIWYHIKEEGGFTFKHNQTDVKVVKEK